MHKVQKMEDCIDIRVIEVKSPSDFIIKEVPALGMSDEAKDYHRLIKELNEYCENDEIIKQAFKPQKGQVYAGKRWQDNFWYRVRMEGCLDRRNGLHASCFLLDDGKIETMPIQSLRMIPEHLQHTQVPYQIKRCSLYGVRPVTLSLSPDARPVISVCDVWDSSAVQRMKELVEASVVRKLRVVKVTRTGVHQVKLYLQTSDSCTYFCLSDKLIQEKYCVAITDSFSDSEGSISDNLSSSQSDGMQSFRSAEDVTQGRKTRRETRSKFALRNIHAKVLAEMGLTKEGKVRTENISRLESHEPARLEQADRRTHGQTIIDQQQPDVDSHSAVGLFPSNWFLTPLPQMQVASGANQGVNQQSCSSRPSLPETIATDTFFGRLSSVSGTGNVLESNVNGGFYPENKESNFRMQDRFPHVVPKSFNLSDSEASSSSETSINRNLRLITQELSKMSNGDTNCGSDSDLSVNSDLNLIRYEDLPNRSLQDVVLNLQVKMASKYGENQTVVPAVNKALSSDNVDQPREESNVGNGVWGEHDHTLITRGSHDLDLSVDSVLSGLLSRDLSAPVPKTRRPNLPLNGPEGLKGRMGSRICFSDDEQIRASSRTEKKVLKSPKTRQGINKRNIALKSILKNCPSVLPEEPRPSPELTNRPALLAPVEDSSDRSSVSSSQSDQENPVLRKAQMGNRILANRLFTQLAGQTKRSQTLDLKTEEPEKYGSWYRPPDGVFIDADIKLRPVETLDGVPFHDRVVKVLRSKNLNSPLLIQSYCWPPLLRGRDVIGIASRNKGQILAYLAPLLTQLIENKPYPEGGGPLVMIVCSSWRRAQEVQSKCETILEELTLPRVMTIFGGGSEQGYNIPLINGCEILIATPYSLTRKLDKYVNLRRLGHLVIDEAELVMGNFKEQVIQVMNSFKEVLKQRGRQTSLPRQLLVFGSHWTSRVESFWDAYMVEPVLVITSQYEAAVFGGTKHFVIMIKAGQRLAKFVDLVGSLVQTTKKIIVFTDNEEEATTVYHTLSASSCYALLATGGADFTPVLKEWHLPHKGSSCPVLVCTDAVVFNLDITDANVVIHYGMARSKTTFGNRLSCAQDYYRKSADLKDKTNCPKSYIFVTENCGPMVMSLVDLLERTKCHIPKELRAMVQGMLEGKERDNPMPLCYYLKAFGTCKLRSYCKKRHVIRADLDKCRKLTMSSLVPNQGEVKVLVSYVENASRFFVRIVQHRGLDGTIHQMDTLYNRLHEALQAWFAIPENRFENGPVQYGDLCCYPEEDRYCRVEVQDVGNMEHYATQRHKSVKIFYVDEGRTEKVTASSLLKLTDNFKGIPFQAVEAYLCRISPVDSDTDWVPKANAFMCSQVRDIELWGKIVLSLGGTLWLDPFVERVYHKTINVTTTNIQIRTLLIRRGYAVENSQHLELLYKACKDKISLPDYSRSVLDVEPEVESLPLPVEDVPDEESSDTTTPVFMSACGSPECFYLRLAERNQELEDLMSKINKDSSQKKAELDEKKIKAGTVCLAKFYIDNSWSRAQIRSVGSDDNVDVFFVDYGDTETISKLDIREIPDKYLRLPFQAIECGFPDVTPVGGSWQDDSGDALWDMVHHHNGDHRQLQAQVKMRRPAVCAGAHRHLVDLVFRSCEEEVNVLQEMVYRKHCLVDNDSVQPLFPSAAGCEVGSPSAGSLAQGAVDLCRSIYNTQNPLVLRTMTQQLKTMLEAVVKGVSLSDEMKEDVLTSLWKLIRYSQHASVYTTLLPPLTDSLLNCQSLLLRVLERRFVVQLCWEICRNKSADVKLTCLRSLLRLSPEEQIKISLSKLENIEALVTTVKESESIKVKALATELLARMCTDSQRTMTDAKAERAIEVLYDEASRHAADSEFAEAFCHFCCILGDHQKKEYYTDFSKDGLLKLLVELIRDTSSHQVIRWTTLLMYGLSERSRRNKTLMLEAGYVPVLKGLPQRFPELTSELQSQWNHLLTSLDVKAPREHLSGDMAVVVHGHLPMDTQRHMGRSISPPVSWYQNSFRVVLSVKLAEVTQKSVTYNDNSVHFKAVCDGKLYEFEFSLCGKIIPSESHEEVRLKEVLISLKKEQKGRWKRLLRDKEKPSFLSIDFERIQDSSDSDGEDSDDNLFIVKHSTRGKPLPRGGAAKGGVEKKPLVYGSTSSDSDDSLNSHDYDSDECDFFKI